MRTLSRRAVCRGLLAGSMLAPSRLRAQDNTALRFEVMRHGSSIGTHAIRFVQAGAELQAHISATFHIDFGPITLFRYTHEAVEIWRNDQFQSLQTKTCNNGTNLSVSATRVINGVRIVAADGSVNVAPADVLPLTHWNQACMQSRLFNPQDGKLLPETARLEGPDSVALANGSRVQAVRYALHGLAPLEEWYGIDRSWAKLRAIAKDGSVVEYVRIA